MASAPKATTSSSAQPKVPVANVPATKVRVPRASVKPQERAAHPLVNLYFHVFGHERKIVLQGKLLAMVGADHVLVRYFDWSDGRASTLELIPLANLARGATMSGFTPHSWQFYESSEEMTLWYASHPDARP